MSKTYDRSKTMHKFQCFTTVFHHLNQLLLAITLALALHTCLAVEQPRDPSMMMNRYSKYQCFKADNKRDSEFLNSTCGIVPPSLATKLGHTNRIIGGKTASKQYFPFMASIRWLGESPKGWVDSHICGGAVISDRFVLTSAHCLTDFNSTVPVKENKIFVHLGVYNISNQDECQQTYAVKALHVHPQYQPIFLNFYNMFQSSDIGLIELARPIHFQHTPKLVSGSVAKICLPDSKHNKFYNNQHNYTPVYLSGWGKVSIDGHATTVNYASFAIDKQSKCESLKELNLTEQTICLRTSCTKSPLHGDSGSPFFVGNPSRRDQPYTVLGLVSYPEDPQISCTRNPRAHLHFVAVRVSYFVNWINGVLAGSKVVERMSE